MTTSTPSPATSAMADRPRLPLPRCGNEFERGIAAPPICGWCCPPNDGDTSSASPPEGPMSVGMLRFRMTLPLPAPAAPTPTGPAVIDGPPIPAGAPASILAPNPGRPALFAATRPALGLPLRSIAHRTLAPRNRACIRHAASARIALFHSRYCAYVVARGARSAAPFGGRPWSWMNASSNRLIWARRARHAATVRLRSAAVEVRVRR
mmetsp:Transcript_49379/g.148730  ORF Transcript_49379/g.148730 Transcript_49379/m.148730 type:complete len:208 (-) Transcript_49379:3050-3673(-)